MKYWYHIDVHYCPVCGRSKKYRQRVYNQNEAGTTMTEYYDWCDV